MSNLSIGERQVRDIVVVDLDGKVTIGETNRQLHETLRKLVAEGKKKIILNLQKVAFIDSSGLGEIVAGYSTLRTHGGSLKLINISDRVTDLMTITKLYTVFDIYESEADGINSFEEHEKRSTQPLDTEFVVSAKASSSLL